MLNVAVERTLRIEQLRFANRHGAQKLATLH